MEQIQQELNHRMELWVNLIKEGAAKNVSPAVLRELGIYGGAQGIWVNKKRTGTLSENGYGAAVSLTHSGKNYPDEWSESGVIYHYPLTRRPEGRDLSEIEATKNAARLGLPVFVIQHTQHSQRSVYLGWVEDWDDELRQFLVIFAEQAGENRKISIARDEPSLYTAFSPFQERNARMQTVLGRPNQQRFKFDVLKRYRANCAVCEIRHLALLQAAHIIPKEHKGSDDARNGIIFCANHHLAFDMQLFAFDPETLEICYAPSITVPNTLQIIYTNIHHLSQIPHKEALQWRFEHWHRKIQ